MSVPAKRKKKGELEKKLEQADHLPDLARAFSVDAFGDLVEQLGLGKTLELIDPNEIFFDRNAGRFMLEDKDDAARMRAIAAHNATVAKLAEVRQKAAEKILPYGIGSPERVSRVIHEGQDRLDLSRLTDDELKALGAVIEGMVKEKGPDQLTEPIEAEILEDD